eukprot:GHRR01035335.1.p1 GENE.GHRR01035335.1~~GHRR01035335.1.p1  ORF type:complete len:116 (+),score=21.87 GHRR01035335.1:239-586(+)
MVVNASWLADTAYEQSDIILESVGWIKHKSEVLACNPEVVASGQCSCGDLSTPVTKSDANMIPLGSGLAHTGSEPGGGSVLCDSSAMSWFKSNLAMSFQCYSIVAAVSYAIPCDT